MKTKNNEEFGKTENNKEFGRSARQNHGRFLTKKMAWEHHDPLTILELAERNFWKIELRLWASESNGNIHILSDELKTAQKPSLIKKIALFLQGKKEGVCC